MAGADPDELTNVINSLQTGQTKDLIKARDMLNSIVQRKTEALKPGAGQAITPIKPQAAIQPAGAPAARPATQVAPKAPEAPGDAGQPSQNLMADIAKVIKAAGEATGSIQKPTTTGAPSGQAQPAGAGQMAKSAVPGRRPM